MLLYPNRGVADKLGENLLLLYLCDSGVFTNENRCFCL